MPTPEPFRIGSQHKIQGTIRENGQPVDLTGSTVVLKIEVNGSAVKTFPVTPDPDQINKKGQYASANLSATDFLPADAGQSRCFAHVTQGGFIHKSWPAVARDVVAAP